MAKTTANKSGKKTREFTQQEKDIVKALAIARTPHAAIAKAIQTDKETLLKYFGDFLEIEKLKFDAFVVGQLAKLIQKGCKTSIYFYLKCQAGWRENPEIENKNIELPRIQVEILPKSRVKNDDAGTNNNS